MKHIEAKLKAALMKVFRERLGYVAIRHEDLLTSGIPDISLTGFAKTSWIEVKHGTPNFESTGIQELTMLRLAYAGYARYLVYIEGKDGSNKRTLIIHPRHLDVLEAEAECPGHNHRWAAEFFFRRHQS